MSFGSLIAQTGTGVDLGKAQPVMALIRLAKDTMFVQGDATAYSLWYPEQGILATAYFLKDKDLSALDIVENNNLWRLVFKNQGANTYENIPAHNISSEGLNYYVKLLEGKIDLLNISLYKLFQQKNEEAILNMELEYYYYTPISIEKWMELKGDPFFPENNIVISFESHESQRSMGHIDFYHRDAYRISNPVMKQIIKILQNK